MKPRDPDTLSKKDLEAILSDRNLRIELARSDPYWFFHLYFPDYIQSPTTPFQKEMFKDLADEKIRQLVIVSFRGSAKSTIATMAYVLWSIIGIQEKKFVVIASQTQQQALQHLRNIRTEIESNELFRNDFGPLEDESTEWGTSGLSIPKFKAKIMTTSRAQAMRGIRNGAHRPDLFICDDIEDSESVKTAESRRDTDNWFHSEVKGIGDIKTKYVIVGNLLHEDSLVMRLKESILGGQPFSKYSEYPIVKMNRPLWPGKYPTLRVVAERRAGIKHAVWMREFMLKIVPEEDQVITRSIINRYEYVPTRLIGQSQHHFVGVDLAVSDKHTADYTAIVSFIVQDIGTDKMRIYVLPNPINSRMDFNRIIDSLKDIKAENPDAIMVIETIAAQDYVAQHLKSQGLKVTGVKPNIDKRSRLNIVADLLQRKIILFPEKGCELLISQLTGYGIEKHDDLMDAFTIAVIEIMNYKDKDGGKVWTGGKPRKPIRGSGGSYINVRSQYGHVTRIHDPNGW